MFQLIHNPQITPHPKPTSFFSGDPSPRKNGGKRLIYLPETHLGRGRHGRVSQELVRRYVPAAAGSRALARVERCLVQLGARRLLLMLVLLIGRRRGDFGLPRPLFRDRKRVWVLANGGLMPSFRVSAPSPVPTRHRVYTPTMAPTKGQRDHASGQYQLVIIPPTRVHIYILLFFRGGGGLTPNKRMRATWTYVIVEKFSFSPSIRKTA